MVDGGKYDAVYYNPNYSDATQGVESNTINKDILKSFSTTLRSVQAYHSPCGNVRSRCSALTWQELYNHVNNGISPFQNDNLNLEDYRHIMTAYSYNKYHKAKRSQSPLKYHQTWSRLDQLIRHIDVSDTAEIASKLSNVLVEYFINK